MNNNLTTFNTENLIKSINNILQEELTKIFSSFLEKYKKYEETYIAVMNLPCVNPTSQVEPVSNVNKDVIENLINTRLKNLEDRIHTLIDKVETYSASVDDVTNQLQKMKAENLKGKTVVDLTIPFIKIEKENIHLEIEEKKEEEKTDEEETDEEESSKEEEDESITTEKAIETEVVAVGSKKEESDEEEENDEEESVETETKEEVEEEEVEEDDVEEEEEEEEEELFEIEIDDITYCTNDENNGYIYEYTNEEVGDKIGYFKEGEPFFYADEK